MTVTFSAEIPRLRTSAAFPRRLRSRHSPLENVRLKRAAETIPRSSFPSRPVIHSCILPEGAQFVHDRKAKRFSDTKSCETVERRRMRVKYVRLDFPY